METYSGNSLSVWMDNIPPIPSDGTLKETANADVCIIGAGIAGLTTAYLLIQSGVQVIVLERNEIGSGMTARTTAHLMSALDDRFYKLEQLYGEEGARLAAQSHRAAINVIEDIIQQEQIDCNFERLSGYLFAAPECSTQELHDEYTAALKAGCDVSVVERAPLAGFDTQTALQFANQGQFHPLKYLTGLVASIRAQNGKIFTHADVQSITENENGLITVETNQGKTVTASAVVVATNTPINNRFEIPLKQSGYMTYVVGGSVPRDSVFKALYWDTLKKYHYVRLTNDPHDVAGDQILLVGGEDHKVGQANDAIHRYESLKTWALHHFPMIQNFKYYWSGEVMEPVDSLGYIGKDPQSKGRIYIATGDSGMGMTHGTLAGIILRDAILNQKNEWASLYDPARKTLSALPEFTKEAINTNAQYSDWLTSGDVHSVNDIPINEGAVIRKGLTKIAVYHDDKNQLHQCSAVCTHLSGIVHWNSNEKTWDCPCHGSRFDAYGNVIQGPANQNLAVTNETL